MIRLSTKYIRRFFAGLYNFFKENLFQVLQTHGGWQLIILVYDILDAVIVNLTEPIESLTAGGRVRLVGFGGLYLPLMPWADTPVLPWLTYHFVVVISRIMGSTFLAVRFALLELITGSQYFRTYAASKSRWIF